MTFPTKYWSKTNSDKIQCDLCPRLCKLSEGQRGLCYVRARQDDKIVLLTYGKSSGFCVDPIEKKPLNHFYPGTPVLSFGTAGCNLACKFCQNWDISKSRQMETIQKEAGPISIAQTALQTGSKSIAFTYNDPVIFLEYAKDVSIEAHKNNLKTIAVTAGYINEKPREEFFSFIDAVNVDLKAFSDEFYQKITGGYLRPVLETLLYLKTTKVWFEITTLLIPGKNDSEKELHKMTEWIVDNLGVSIPLHFTAFHPDWKMMDVSHTPHHTLLKACKIAKDTGMHYVYAGNVHDMQNSSTYCHNCNNILIERNWYELGKWNLNNYGQCTHCLTQCEGYFEKSPGSWGRKRLPVAI